MEIHCSFLAAAAAALVLSSVSLVAGPAPEFWNLARPVITTKAADAVKPDETAMMVCGACKTVMVRSSRSVGSPNQNHQEWFIVGSKHKCDHCGGEMSVVRGKTADSMQHNCSMCGEGAAFCCAVSKDEPPAKK